MVDFILRHGNDLLAVECLRGFEVRGINKVGNRLLTVFLFCGVPLLHGVSRQLRVTTWNEHCGHALFLSCHDVL